MVRVASLRPAIAASGSGQEVGPRVSLGLLPWCVARRCLKRRGKGKSGDTNGTQRHTEKVGKMRGPAAHHAAATMGQSQGACEFSTVVQQRGAAGRPGRGGRKQRSPMRGASPGDGNRPWSRPSSRSVLIMRAGCQACRDRTALNNSGGSSPTRLTSVATIMGLS